MPTVALVGTLDTKGTEYAFVRDRLHQAGVDTLVVDTGVQGAPTIEADVSRADVATRAGEDVQELASANDRGKAVTAMANGAAKVLAQLHADGKIDGALALGGTGGTSIAAQAFRQLPLGMPKLIVSTAASGDTRAYVGETDLVLMPSVTDVAGVNRLSARILANAAAAIAGMVSTPAPETNDDRRLVAASMFGVTTPAVTTAKAHLETLDYEVLVFHMTGVGGRTLESLANDGWLAGVLDLTTTELADELVGGVFSAGPERLTAAAGKGIPQVVSVGALDMVNFGPRETVPTAVRGPQPLRPQPQRHAHAHDSRGVRRARQAPRDKSVHDHWQGDGLPAVARRLRDRHRGRPVLRQGRRRRAVRRDPREPRP